MKTNLLFPKVIVLLFVFLSHFEALGGVSVVPTGQNQKDFLKAYRFALIYSYVDYRFTNATMDSLLFPKFGEFSIYWVKSGSNRGAFIYPDVIPRDYSSVTNFPYTNYDWANQEHYSLQFKHNTNVVCIFRSEQVQSNTTVSWGAVYYKNLFDFNFYDNMYYFATEKILDSIGVSTSTRLLIIPPFRKMGEDDKYYIDKIIQKYSKIKENLNGFLARGGTIYAEGNAVYFLAKLGLLPANSVDFQNPYYGNAEDNTINVAFNQSDNPLAFSELAVGNKLYASYVPKITLNDGDVVATVEGTTNPVVFVLSGASANGGRIVVNTGLPTIGGMNELNKGSRQLQWTLNSIFYAFCSDIDVTRSLYNELPKEITAGANAISYDRLDTFEVRVKIRNLKNQPVENVSIIEYIRPYFKYVGLKKGQIQVTQNGNNVTFSNISLSSLQELEIIYLISTPDPLASIHEEVNKYISWANYIYVSYSEVKVNNRGEVQYFVKYRNYAELMFSARLVADTDLNWKNFLYLDFQPFKVFTIIENKERTSAVETKYVQYIPKDVPFYWTDKTINIPILRTPGGKYVDILRGSNDKNNPEFDFDSDGYPDVWLDTASIYPKGYTIEETEVYWINPWESFRSGDTAYYEDINHDGIRAKDINGDGIVDIEAPGDKIRVWKVTWNIGKVAGYEYFDPYCYYEIWVDPPDLVPLSAGVGYTFDKLDENVPGMFYPYTPDISKANPKDDRWKHWMETDKDGKVVWKQLIYQKIHNYEGFTFIDTLKENYKLKPTDRCAGTVPQPHREFIAVLSLGGREIDMNKPTPDYSPYSNLEYKTIFNEKRYTPIRTTYTYYAPLPNPLQFEYLTNNFIITDTSGTVQYKYLPEWGKALLTFTMDASTEYSYYWIRNAGHDVDYNDPSEKIEGKQELGDGVFGYVIYDIPKGIGGYRITLPKKPDGSYDIDKIVKVDGKQYQKWLENPNTRNDIQITEDPFEYHIHIPQILIPPALDDDNNDGIDDWIDDRGDRFQSSTGFLHDAFMLDNGEDWKDYPKVPFKDDIYGMVRSGWFCGADSTYGDDEFEQLGRTQIQISAIYEGLGKEGSVEISKGGWLVVEEIFGGSPWVIFSHTLSGFAMGSDVKITSRAQPTQVRFGIDTAYILHTIEDVREPHSFDINFDPYHVSYGYGDVTLTTFAGGKDPCNLIAPAIDMPTIIDQRIDKRSITILPFADSTNPIFKGYPKRLDGTFFEVRIELNNGTYDNFVNTTIEPVIPSDLKNTKLVFSYVSYPRPLVPAKFDPATGEIIRGGDDLGTLRTGWRFNQPEGEVLVELGSTLNLLQATRKAYFIFLFQIDSTLPNGVYSINFNIKGERIYYDGTKKGNLGYEVPPVMFSITKKNNDKTIAEYQKLVLGNSDLSRAEINGTLPFRGLGEAKWSEKVISPLDFDTLKRSLPVKFDANSRVETIDLSSFKGFPKPDFTRFYILEKVEVNSAGTNEKFNLTNAELLYYKVNPYGNFVTSDKPILLSSVGPKVTHFKRISGLNGKKLQENEPLLWLPEQNLVEVTFYILNTGSDVAQDVGIQFEKGKYFEPIPDQSNLYDKGNGVYFIPVGFIVPGELKEISVVLSVSNAACESFYDESTIIRKTDIAYNGARTKSSTKKEAFYYRDESLLNAPSYDFYIADFKPNIWEVRNNEEVKLNLTIANGLLPLLGAVQYDIYAIVNFTDTLLIKQDTVSAFDVLGKRFVEATFFVPDSAYFLEFFAVVDPTNSFPEICKANNRRIIPMEFIGPDWMRKVNPQPNPFHYFTEISYVLNQDVFELRALIFSLDGSLVATIENCPNSLGVNQLLLNLPNIAKGTYLIRFEGITPENQKLVNFVKVVKEK